MNRYTQVEVNESLNNAIENGCDHIKDFDAYTLAEDLVDYDAKYENADIERLAVLIENWLDANP